MAPRRNTTHRSQKQVNTTIQHVNSIDHRHTRQPPKERATTTRSRCSRRRLCSQNYHKQTEKAPQISKAKRRELGDLLREFHLPWSKKRSEEIDTYQEDNDLELPFYWPVFDAILDSQTALLPGFGVTDSSASISKSNDDTDIGNWQDADADMEVAVDCCSGTLSTPRLRGFWTFLSSMVPERFQWSLQTHERALRHNERRHVGYLDLNQPSTNHDLWPQHSMENLLSLWEDSETDIIPSTEIDWPSKFGRLITNVVATDLFAGHYRQPLHWPEPFILSGSPPVIDFTCRVKPDTMGWPDELSPLLFAAHYAGYDREHAIVQLAKAFQPMMTLFILYYLDCRASRKEDMPSWMILFGIVYGESGLSIRAHYPCFNPPPISSKSTRSRGWGSASRSMGNDYVGLIYDDPSRRSSFLATLNRIQGHCLYVMQRLQAWNGYEAAVSRLLV